MDTDSFDGRRTAREAETTLRRVSQSRPSCFLMLPAAQMSVMKPTTFTKVVEARRDSLQIESWSIRFALLSLSVPPTSKSGFSTFSSVIVAAVVVELNEAAEAFRRCWWAGVYLVSAAAGNAGRAPWAMIAS